MIGTVVGNYKIVEKIGEGGMGSVFRGIDIMLEREVAIKMLRPEFASQPNVVERFRTEAVTLAKLSHPNIATLHSFFRQRDDFFMVMEFVRGETLDDTIRSRGAMTLDHALPLFCQALEGIGHAHRMGIIHRDIKPANMMLTPEGSIKVMDFGIARVLGTARMTRQGAIVGTIEYMSPEQVRGEEGDARSDVYSLGILLYQMLTGRVPFSSTSEFELMRAQTDSAPTPPRTFVAEIPLQVEQVIMRALAKRVEARFQTAGEFCEVVTMALGGNGGPMTNRAIIAAAPSIPPATPAFTPAASKEVLKETRLGGEFLSSAQQAQVRATPDWRSESEPKETRLGFREDSQLAAAGVTQESGGIQMGAMETRPSLLSKLDWKHFAGAGVAILIGVSIAMFGFGKKEPLAAKEVPTETSPRAPTPRSEEPPAVNPSIQPERQPELAPLANTGQPRTGSSSSARRGSNRGDGQTTAGAPPTVAPPRTVPAQATGTSTPSQSHPTQQPKEEKPGPQAAVPEIKTEDKKEGVASKVGTRAKKVFGKIFGGGDKDKDKDKNKKP